MTLVVNVIFSINMEKILSDWSIYPKMKSIPEHIAREHLHTYIIFSLDIFVRQNSPYQYCCKQNCLFISNVYQTTKLMITPFLGTRFIQTAVGLSSSFYRFDKEVLYVHIFIYFNRQYCRKKSYRNLSLPII